MLYNNNAVRDIIFREVEC